MTNHDQDRNQDRDHNPPRKLTDDPRFTAYALGELEGEQRARFEAELALDEDAQRELAELRALTGELETELGAQPTYELSSDQRAAIVGTLSGPPTTPHLVPDERAGSWRSATGILAAAASLAVGVWLVDRSPRELPGSDPADVIVARHALSTRPPQLTNSGSGESTPAVPPIEWNLQRWQQAESGAKTLLASPDSQLDDLGIDFRGLGQPGLGSGEFFRSFGAQVDPPALISQPLAQTPFLEPSTESALTADLNGLGSSITPEVGYIARSGESPQSGVMNLSDYYQIGDAPVDSLELDAGRVVATGNAHDGELLSLFANISRERVDPNAVVNTLEDGITPAQGAATQTRVPFSATVVAPKPEDWAALGELRDFSTGGIEAVDLTQGSLVAKVAEIDHAILEAMSDDAGKRVSYETALVSERKLLRLLELRDELTQLDAQRQAEPSNTEAYQRIVENAFTRVADAPLSTFSIDVDTASYANVRRFLSNGQLPPPDAVRIEELVNYFDYEYPPSVGPEPFSAHAEVAACPWAPEHQLVKIGLLGRSPMNGGHAAAAKNLVFLIDVSGSMQSHDKIELLKQGLRLLVPGLGDEDTVAIAVYAGASGLVLPATSDKATILAALDGLQAGGSTNGAAGIELAYQTAAEHFRPEGTNRVILCTDGDFNVGVTSEGDLQRLIEEKRESGVFLSVLGFGSGNLKDSTMETLANHGNGVYYYIDSLREAEKVLVRELHATLETIAKDVKIQVEFNPAEVGEYRLIGYENRALAARDFNDDTKDAGEIGAGHTVTAFYEVVPQGTQRSTAGAPPVDDLKYQPSSASEPTPEPTGLTNGELLTVKLRYKQPSSDTSTKLELPVMATDRAWTQTSEDFRFAAGVALFGMCLRGSAHANGATLGTALELAQEGAGPDPWGYRAEFLSLVQRAIELR